MGSQSLPSFGAVRRCFGTAFLSLANSGKEPFASLSHLQGQTGLNQVEAVKLNIDSHRHAAFEDEGRICRFGV